MSRLAGRFRRLAEQGRKALVPYVVAGDPGLEVTVPLMHRMVAAGADVIELGVPFSDPMSEGPVIQLGHERGYANPVVRMGFAQFAEAAAAAGVDALLTVDIPPEEVAPLNAELQRVDMDNILLVAPTTPAARIKRITETASGFIYYVSLKGVTGAGHLDVADVAYHLGLIREHSTLPVAVGFGIRDAASARAVAAVADGVVVGSALVNVMAKAIEAGADLEAAMEAVVSLLSEIRQGIDSATS